MRKNSIHPFPVKRINEMILYNGLFGKVFGGCDADLKFEPPVKSCPTNIVAVCHTEAHTFRVAINSAYKVSSAKREKECLNYFREESIGVSCVP